ncbi:predicted protein, partial [Nematostella vectensis]
FFPLKVPNWFHFSCFFKKQFKPKSLAEIAGIDGLRWDDQEKFRAQVYGGASDVPDTTAAATVSVEQPDLLAEYAKSSRSTCKHCDEQIVKGELRLAKVMDGEKYGPVPKWHHVPCFLKAMPDLDISGILTAQHFTGFQKLGKDDQKLLIDKFGSQKQISKKKGKKKSLEASAAMPVKSASEEKEEQQLKEQSEAIWKIRDELKTNCSLSELREMLEDNEINPQGGETSVFDRCSDGMLFGRLLPCHECHGGMLVYRSDGYHCTGNVSGWTKCAFTTQDPKRTKWVISKELKKTNDFLKTFKCKEMKRLFPKLTAIQPGASTVFFPMFLDSFLAIPGKPLSNMMVAVIGKLKRTKADVASCVAQLGGTTMDRVTSKVDCCISTQAEVSKSSKKMKDAEKFNIPVVSEEFLDAIKDGEFNSNIAKHSLVSWGKIKALDIVDGPLPLRRKASDSKYELGKTQDNTTLIHGEDSLPKKVKLSVKGGAAVDPASEMEDDCHVLEVKGVVYSATLGMVDISRGTNSYYKLQVLKKDKSSRCYLFRSWGRVGTTIGGSKLEDCGNSHNSAVQSFEELYREKTGNEWSERDNFVKHPNRFYPLEIDYGQAHEDVVKAKIEMGSKSKLPSQIQELIKMIFDVESMKKTLIEFEIDLKKMPLGKLTKRQIEKAYSVLGEAQQILSEAASKTAVLDVSNRFYTLIPHDFGMRKPPLLDNQELIKTKIEMLDNLIDIEVAFSLLQSSDGEDAEDPIDINYKKLKTDIEVLDHKSAEFGLISEYVSNTHADTHRQYELELLDVFKIKREGEEALFKPFKQLHNRQLLWHGSRTTNYAGILSQGLRIAPPEAPVTGYMFGKGVYFADMVSKSANYCCTSPSNNIGLLLLCEVALGNMHELKHASFIKKVPKGKHSVKGLGKTAPDPSATHTFEDGTIVPKGKGCPAPVKDSSLLYNEYIVYDTAQINMKYLLKTKFKYKYGW